MRNVFTLFVVLILLAGSAACAGDGRTREKTPEEIALEQAYMKQNKALMDSDNQYGYRAYRHGTLNPDGNYNYEYVRNACYLKYTGIVMTHEQIVDYLSEEFESDGEVRIYDNGRHPEIAAFVEWSWENQELLQEYEDRLSSIYTEYRREYWRQGFEGCPMYEWTTEVMDEIIKKEADPDYELDLLGIQQREQRETD